MTSDADIRLARWNHDKAQAEITRLNGEIGKLINRRSEQELIVEKSREIFGKVS